MLKLQEDVLANSAFNQGIRSDVLQSIEQKIQVVQGMIEERPVSSLDDPRYNKIVGGENISVEQIPTEVRLFFGISAAEAPHQVIWWLLLYKDALIGSLYVLAPSVFALLLSGFIYYVGKVMIGRVIPDAIPTFFTIAGNLTPLSLLLLLWVIVVSGIVIFAPRKSFVSEVRSAGSAGADMDMFYVAEKFALQSSSVHRALRSRIIYFAEFSCLEKRAYLSLAISGVAVILLLFVYFDSSTTTIRLESRPPSLDLRSPNN